LQRQGGVSSAHVEEALKADRATASPETLAPAEIREQPAVQEALEKAAPAEVEEKEPRPSRRGWVFGAAATVLALVYVLSERGVFLPVLSEQESARRGILAALLTTALLALHSFASALVVPRLRSPAVRYNVRRILKLVVVLLITLSIVSVLFVGWYGAVVSFGLLSLILGLALQQPITSFFAWVFILARSPYRVGDRVRIGLATGDIIDVGYLDTTLWEFGGEFLSTDHPSGRIIRFPNSMVFNSMVYNYSWPLFPYVWNEITVQVAYETDLEFVESVMKSTVEEEMGKAMSERVKVYRELLSETPVDHLEVDDRPTVLFRVNANSWVDATVRYLVTPRRAGRRKTLLTRRILERLNADPGRARFPTGNSR
jgi:small-conductance mechanosensitive channel